VVLGAMLLERLLDLLAVVLLAGCALVLLGGTAPVVLVATFELVLCLSASAVLILLFGPAVLSRIVAKCVPSAFRGIGASIGRVLQSISEALSLMGSWRLLVPCLALSLLCWGLESLIFVACWRALGGPADAAFKPFLAFAFGTLGSLVPGLPGSFGTYEFFGVQALTLVGVDASFAAAVVLLSHLVLWLPIAFFGALWLLSATFFQIRRSAS
jgi:glycosyltransferase 2 family protein